jgi:hypothetical protein
MQQLAALREAHAASGGHQDHAPQPCQRMGIRIRHSMAGLRHSLHSPWPVSPFVSLFCGHGWHVTASVAWAAVVHSGLLACVQAGASCNADAVVMQRKRNDICCGEMHAVQHMPINAGGTAASTQRQSASRPPTHHPALGAAPTRPPAHSPSSGKVELVLAIEPALHVLAGQGRALAASFVPTPFCAWYPGLSAAEQNTRFVRVVFQRGQSTAHRCQHSQVGGAASTWDRLTCACRIPCRFGGQGPASRAGAGASGSSWIRRVTR